MSKSHIHETSVMPYSSEQMYQLVNDVERYPEFLPWCHLTKILEKMPSGIIASIEVAGKGIHKSFTTRNTMDPYKFIKMELIEGPFKEFTAAWHFEALENSTCKVSLDMKFEFSSKIMAMLLSKFLNRALEHMIEAFSKRAQELYGK
jgi:ribosome-associated toxin RatA of RatAB toxin-antitoxin module